MFYEPTYRENREFSSHTALIKPMSQPKSRSSRKKKLGPPQIRDWVKAVGLYLAPIPLLFFIAKPEYPLGRLRQWLWGLTISSLREAVSKMALWIPTLWHFAWNALTVLSGFIASNSLAMLRSDSAYRIYGFIRSYRWWTTLSLAFVVLLLWRYKKLKGVILKVWRTSVRYLSDFVVYVEGIRTTQFLVRNCIIPVSLSIFVTLVLIYFWGKWDWGSSLDKLFSLSWWKTWNWVSPKNRVSSSWSRYEKFLNDYILGCMLGKCSPAFFCKRGLMQYLPSSLAILIAKYIQALLVPLYSINNTSSNFTTLMSEDNFTGTYHLLHCRSCSFCKRF